jgi:hypothetical protein
VIFVIANGITKFTSTADRWEMGKTRPEKNYTHSMREVYRKKKWGGGRGDFWGGEEAQVRIVNGFVNDMKHAS